MPLFEFYCSHCEEFFELLMKEHKPWIECPKCKEKAYKQVSMHASYTIHGDNSASTRPGSKE